MCAVGCADIVERAGSAQCSGAVVCSGTIEYSAAVEDAGTA